MLYRITVKNSKLTSGIRVEKGMSVDVVSNSMSNPVVTNGGQTVVDAFMRIYGIDIKKAGALSMAPVFLNETPESVLGNFHQQLLLVRHL